MTPAAERSAFEAARASPGGWLLPGAGLEDAADALRVAVALEDDVGRTMMAPPYELLDQLGCAALVDWQLRSAFARWVAALQRRRLARAPGSFGSGA